MSRLSKFLWGSGKNPANAAQPWLQKSLDVQQPIIQQGNQAREQLNAQNNQLTANPNDYFNDLMSKYTKSAGYQANLDEQLGAAGNTAAAGGFRGTAADTENSQKIANSLLAKDQQQWYNNQIGLLDKGRQGQQHTGDQGVAAIDNQSNIYGDMSTNAAQGVQWENASKQQKIQMLTKMLSVLGGGIVGGATGGVTGAISGALNQSNNQSKFI